MHTHTLCDGNNCVESVEDATVAAVAVVAAVGTGHWEQQKSNASAGEFVRQLLPI